MYRRRRPPLRECRDCGRRFAAWNEHAVHQSCPARLPESTLLDELRERRQERREAQGVAIERTQEAPELAPAHDGIPF